MNKYVMTKQELLEWLKSLAQGKTVLTPQKVEEVYNYAEWDQKTIPGENYQNTLKTPKDLFFPQHEVLLKYQKVKGERPRVEAPEIAKEPRVIFGIRPCDAKSLTLLDKVFISDVYCDPYYKARRDNTLIVSLVCQKPGIACFCADPFSIQGADIQFVALDNEKYLVQVISDKGREAFQEASYVNAGTEEEAKVAELQLAREEIATADIPEKLADMFDHPVWQEIEEKCLNCGVCSFLCPTCHCFDITDDQKGARVRSWDTCMFSNFTKHGSGHNPRPSGKERMRQRIMHKFYYFPLKNGEVACVGCGRCVENCPVNLDIRQVIKAIRGVS